MGAWGLIVDAVLPVPIVFICLLLAPAPRWFTRGTLRITERTLGLEFFHTFKLLHVMLVISGLAFLSSCRTTAALYSSSAKEDAMMNVPNMLSASLGRRWRAERNFWLSALTFFSWCVLARLYVVVRRLAQLNDRIEELQSPTGPIKDVPEPVDVVEELKKAK
mmetsp:Transcript_12515/g.37575  ORF Transcript_12515/g.37575 Transcript_12515/m.37575 type:complete len:163 (+) Transcript_12515:250-738(+)